MCALLYSKEREDDVVYSDAQLNGTTNEIKINILLYPFWWSWRSSFIELNVRQMRTRRKKQNKQITTQQQKNTWAIPKLYTQLGFILFFVWLYAKRYSNSLSGQQ